MALSIFYWDSMSTKLRLTKDRLVLSRWDGDTRHLYKYKKVKGGGIDVVDKATGAVFKTVADSDAADELFWHEEDIKASWIQLRDAVEIDPDVTLNDLFRIIDEDEFLFDFVYSLFPFCADIRGTDDELPDYIEINNVGLLTKDNLSFKHRINCKVCLDEVGHLPIRLGDVKIIGLDGVLVQNKYNYICLIDLLYALFAESANFDLCELRKDGLYNLVENRYVDPTSSLENLFNPCVIAEDFCLHDMFNYVASNEKLKDFISMYSWCAAIDEFHEQAKLPVTREEPEDHVLEYLEIYYHHCKNTKYGFDFPSAEFHAVGRNAEGEGDHYSVSYSPVNEFAHLPLRINPHVEIWDFGNKGRGITNVKARYSTKVSSTTLLDILDAVYFDISFMGGPEDNKAFLEDMRGRVEEYKEGKGEVITLEELEEKIKKEQEED